MIDKKAAESSQRHFLPCFYLEPMIIHSLRSWPCSLINCVHTCVRLLFEGGCSFYSNKYGIYMCIIVLGVLRATVLWVRGRCAIHTYVQCRTSDACTMQMCHPNPNAWVNNVIHVYPYSHLYLHVHLPTNCQNLIAPHATIISGCITNLTECAITYLRAWRQ